MDINRVELKGRVSADIIKRTTAKGSTWLSFTIVTNEFNGKTEIEREKSVPTWHQIAVFNPILVEKILKLGVHQGTTMFVVGKLFSKSEQKQGVNVTYTSVVASEVEVIKTKVTKDNAEQISAPNKEDNVVPF